MYFKKLVNLDPDNVGVIGTYGRVLAMAGKVEDSKKILENALRLAEERNEEQHIEQVCMTKHVSPYRLLHAFKRCFRISFRFPPENWH